MKIKEFLKKLHSGDYIYLVISNFYGNGRGRKARVNMGKDFYEVHTSSFAQPDPKEFPISLSGLSSLCDFVEVRDD